MFDDVLIESAGKDKQKGGWITALISMAVHLAVIGGLVLLIGVVAIFLARPWFEAVDGWRRRAATRGRRMTAR